MRILTVAVVLAFWIPVYGQTVTYIDKNEEIQLWGPIEIENLNKKPYQEWFAKNYDDFEFDVNDKSWTANMQDIQVKIFMGTWCSDSQQWVPSFIRSWDELGLARSQIKIIALSNEKDNYKQSTDGEEMGLGIHRVPTFIFERNSSEIGRIVEYPYSDLESDLKQIAMGNAPGSNFKTAEYVYNLLDSEAVQKIDNEMDNHVETLADFSYDSGELSKLGYVYLRSGMMERAIITFKINSILFPKEINVYDSYAEALIAAGDEAKALENYQKVLELDPKNKIAKDQINKLKETIKK